MKKISLVIVLAMLVSACAPSGSMPRLINGYTYMTGGPDCESWYVIGNGKLVCKDENNINVGYRTPMALKEIKAWQKAASFHDDMAFQSAFGWALGSGGPTFDPSIFSSPSAAVSGILNLPSYTPKTYAPKKSAGTSLYSPSECIGAVVNGRCAGNINPRPSNVLRKKCYGPVINGQCQGAILGN